MFAKLVNVNQTDDERVLAEMRNDFLGQYFPFALREQYKEPKDDPSLVYPQYDSRTIRGMISDEITSEFNSAANKIRHGKAQVREMRKPMMERKNILKEATDALEKKLSGSGGVPETRLHPGKHDPLHILKRSGPVHRKEYLRALEREHVLSDEEISDDDETNKPSFKVASFN